MTDPNLTHAIMKDLGELKGTQSAILTLLTKQDQRLDQHSDRLGRLEKSKAWVLGAAAVVGAISSFILKSAFGVGG